MSNITLEPLNKDNWYPHVCGLSSDRWKFYLAQTRENKFASDKAGYIAEKGALWKRGAVAYRKEQKNGGIWL